MPLVSLLREIAKNTALAVPALRRQRVEAWRRARSDEDARTPAYARRVFELHRAAVERYRPLSGHVLEIGPGVSLAVAALFVQAGADEAVCIDVLDWRAPDAPGLYRQLGLEDDVLERVRHVCPCPVENAPFADESFDVIFSQACYQRFRDPAAATRNIARMLRPGGVTSHQIDLRDNRDFERPLDFLRIGDVAWRLATSRRSLTNRWRASDILDAFAREGLVVLQRTVNRSIDVTPEMAASFTRRFRSKTLDDLGVLGLFVVAVKPRLPERRR